MYQIALVLFINMLLERYETCLRWVPDMPAEELPPDDWGSGPRHPGLESV